MPILCGTDLSEGALPGLEAGAAIATRVGERDLCVVHVLESGGHPDTTSPRGREMTERAPRLASAVEDLCGRYPVPSVRHRVLEGTPAETLARFAEAEGAALLVVSSRGHGGAPLQRLGGTSERVAVECGVPVLVVRDARPFVEWAREGRPLRIVLGVDWTPATDAAVQLVRWLRASGPVDVVIAHVYYPGVSSRWGLEPLGPANEPDGTVEQLVGRDLEARVAELGGVGDVLYRPTLGFGRIGDDLLAVAAAERADLVVVGSHRRRGYRRLASISSVVLHHSRCSVGLVGTTSQSGASPPSGGRAGVAA
jgi:nucleotide-binding universal stress UspA family protein